MGYAVLMFVLPRLNKELKVWVHLESLDGSKYQVSVNGIKSLLKIE